MPDDSAYGDDGLHRLAYAVERRFSGKHKLTLVVRRARGGSCNPEAKTGGQRQNHHRIQVSVGAWIIIPVVAATGLVVGGMVAYRIK